MQCGPRGALLQSVTFVVAGNPLQAVSKSHFSSNKVSENSDLSQEMASAAAGRILAICDGLRSRAMHVSLVGSPVAPSWVRENLEALVRT